MFHKALAVLLLSVIYIPGECQLKLEKYNSSTEIHENESLTFIGDTLLIDTLIMQNNSTLKVQSYTYIHIKYAILGESVSILNEGVVGTRGDVGVLLFPIGTDGERGTDGNNITMVIGIEKLGSLYLSTRGGNGGNGGGGHSGHRSASGGKGGCGGNSGDIHFTYVANNIIPIFNRSGRSNSIYLDSEGGAGGRGGYGGKTSRRGSYDRKVAPSGSSGCKGKDGKIMLKKL